MSVIPVQRGTGVATADRNLVQLARAQCAQLEAGNILLCLDTPFALDNADLAALQRCESVRTLRKNITYDPARDRLTGAGRRAGRQRERLRSIMRRYSQHTTAWLGVTLLPYARSWHVDLASLRPIEEEQRRLPYLQRNDLLHIDAFPSRPTNGARILRVFTNVHPTRPRRWATAGSFESFLEHYSAAAGFPLLRRTDPRWHRLRRAARALGFVAASRSAYDSFMLRLHDFLKRNDEFQACPNQVHAFPPHSSWVVFTDAVAHAALSGQFALEQTFIVPRSVLVAPELAPVSILERFYGARLTEPDP